MTLVPAAPGAATRAGFGPPCVPDQVLRNHSVGRTWSVAAVGPRFVTPMRIRMSSGAAFAYSTTTSK